MSAKQDRQGARTVTDLERKYKFGESFAEAMGFAESAKKSADEAQNAANEASSAVNGLDNKLDQKEIFLRLTNNGASQGIYMGDDGEIYINASFVVAGILAALNGKTTINLATGEFESLDNNGTSLQIDSGSLVLTENGVTLIQLLNTGVGGALAFGDTVTGTNVASFLAWPSGLMLDIYDRDEGASKAYTLQWKEINGVKTLVGM